MLKKWTIFIVLCITIAWFQASIHTVYAPQDTFTNSNETTSTVLSDVESDTCIDESSHCTSQWFIESIEDVASIPDESLISVYTPADDELVLVAEYAPEILLDIRYATVNNFTGTIIYTNADAYLRYGTLCKLIAVHNELQSHGYGLKIWDAYRPIEAQFKLWKVYPDASFVANPLTGYSNHSRGNTVDVTIVTIDGAEVEMPSLFDEFGKKAHRQYTDDAPDVAERATLLQECMYKHGFDGYYKEWWHYTDTTKYPIVK